MKPSERMTILQRLSAYGQKMRRGDLTCYYQEDEILADLQTLDRYKYMMSPDVKEKLIDIFNMFKARIDHYPYTQQLFPFLNQVIDSLQRTYEYSGSRRNAGVDEELTDRGYEHLVQEI